MVMRASNETTSHSSSNNDSDRNNNQTLKKLLADQPLLPQMVNQISLDEILIEGRWKFRRNENDHLRFKSMGVENLVYICHDIMNKTQEIIRLKRQTSSSSSQLWTIVKVDRFKTLTDAERAHLNRAHILDLMTIIFEATSTNASISQLVRIWRETSEHIHRHCRVSPSYQHQPKISYEIAFKHLIHTPDNSLLQVALHASLITGHSRMDLQEFGEKLGVKPTLFDMGSIKDSTNAFTNLIKFLREQKLKRDREQQAVDIHKLPYKPRKKRGLNANVSGTKFPVGKLFCIEIFQVLLFI